MFMFKRNEKIGPYIVEFPIKEGRQAESYRVTDGNVTYFLKLIDHSKLDETQTNDKGQLWEVEILKSLSHPNIVKYHDSCDIDIDGKKYTMIVTNFISGETVAQRMARKQGCSVYEAKRIIIAVLKAVAYMHEAEHPVIHNELTVQNVMIDMSGREEVARVIGFGYARMPNGNHKSIFCRNDLNPFYLAPEVFDGKCTEQSDVFSVGAMLYHVLFGLPPYFTDISLKKWDNDSLKAAISKEREKPLRILERNKFDLSQHLLDILNKALAVDPENRYKTAQEFLLDIRRKTQSSINSQCRKRMRCKIKMKNTYYMVMVSPMLPA
jgi:transitional endoplasmic reticulum ATPase